MEEIARVYAEALFDIASEHDKIDEIRDQLSEFADAVDSDQEMQVFLFSPYFSSAEKQAGIEKAVTGADERFVNFLALLAEKHRMAAIFRIRDTYEELWQHENRRIEVVVKSAVELDADVAERIGAEIEKQTGRKVDLSSEVDESIVGGLVLQVGNMVLDASIANRLEKLRKSVASAA